MLGIREHEEYIRFRGPCPASPRALPPFLLKWDVMSVVMGWKTQEETMPAASLTTLVSSMKIAMMSAMSVGLLPTIKAQYV